MKKVLFLADRRGWAYDTCIRSFLPFINEYECDIAYVWEKPNLNEYSFDLLYVCWWGENYHNQFGVKKDRIIKEISSHRWQYEKSFGRLPPWKAYEKFMRDAGTLTTTSGRLFRAFHPVAPRLMPFRLGTSESIIPREVPRTGCLTFGWSGSPKDPQKGLTEIIRPAVQGICRLHETDGTIDYKDMDIFYDGIDVLLIGSLSEGTPLPLLEAMRKGCFIVGTDVGVVNELILSGVNGLIVPRTVEDFRTAISWCQENTEFVRIAGLNNSRISSVRSWSDAAICLQNVFKNHIAAYA